MFAACHPLGYFCPILNIDRTDLTFTEHVVEDLRCLKVALFSLDKDVE
uniref:Uncharacterized protein n=1 Tax=Vibrio tasmaniensis TaxID=212663 RepID=A0A0H3ZP62_9VIBR|nr:hypothetical protein [Vibrio tasmaniensis]